MAMTRANEARLLSESQRALVAPSHYPALAALPPGEAAALAERLREELDRLRGTVRDAQRAKRGQGEARGGPDDPGASMKKQVFAAALRRVVKRIEISGS